MPLPIRAFPPLLCICLHVGRCDNLASWPCIGVGTEGAGLLAAALKSNGSLKQLDMQYNIMGAEVQVPGYIYRACTHFGAVRKTQTILTHLD